VVSEFFIELQGDCRDYAMWLRADTGDKNELTRLPSATHHRLPAFLGRVASALAARGVASPGGYRRDGGVYKPVG
jgi:hypothetical protein